MTRRPLVLGQNNRWQLLWQSGSKEPARRKVVLGLGNLLMSDEGLGIQALPYLQSRIRTAADVEWVDGGVLGMNLLPLVEACSHLLVVDAVNAGQPPGTVIQLEARNLLRQNGLKLSEHQVTFQEVLGLATLLERAPDHLQLVGLQPASLAVSTILSQPVAAALPMLAERAAAILDEWGFLA